MPETSPLYRRSPMDSFESPLLTYLEKHPVTLIETTQSVSLEQVNALSQFPGQTIVACDFYIDQIEKHLLRRYGFEAGNVRNIDHHANVDEMRRYISSGNLAIEYVNEFGPCNNNELVVINHRDTDSIISSLIVRGALAPESRFGEAVIAADHQGLANPIADLLQSIGLSHRDKPLPERFSYCVRNLDRLFHGLPLEPLAQVEFDKRISDRLKAKEMVESGQIRSAGHVSYAIADGKMDPELFLQFLPNSLILLFAYPKPNSTDLVFETRLRLGMNPPPGFSLLDLGITQTLDSKFGGRWNAGSNRRGGGTTLAPDEYAARLSLLVDQQLAQLEP